MQRAMLCSAAIVTVGLAASIGFASTFTRPPIRAAKSAASLLGRSTSKPSRQRRSPASGRRFRVAQTATQSGGWECEPRCGTAFGTCRADQLALAAALREANARQEGMGSGGHN